MRHPQKWWQAAMTIAACATLASCGDATVETGPDPAEISAIAEREQIPGLAAGIIRDGEVAWQHTHGHADRESGISVDRDTIFLIASVSKAVTAAAVMHAYETGAIDLDADVNSYLPFSLRHPEHAQVPITARLLLTHRAGLAQPFPEIPEFFVTFPVGEAPPLFPWIPDYVQPDRASYEARIWKSWAPGEQTQYSNMGAAVLGYVVEAATGQDFAEYVRENVFLPLGMNGTSFRLDQVPSDRLATLYVTADAVIAPYDVPFYPASMVRTSLADLAKFAGAIAGGGVWQGRRILRKETVREMLRLEDADDGIALLWQDSGGGWRGHGGNFFGGTARIDVDPATGTAIVLLANRTSVGAIARGGEIYDLVRSEAQSDR